jgi:hypothetical protein
MGRSKPQPKRRRVDEEEKERQAIAALLAAPPEQVDAAAAEATRMDICNWPTIDLTTTSRLDDDDDNDDDTSSIDGIGHCTLDPSHAATFQQLHDTIKSEAAAGHGSWTSWSGAPTDPRRRAFGFVPGTLGYQSETRDQLDISTPWQPEQASVEERPLNAKAMVILEKKSCPPDLQEAVDSLCQQLVPFAPKHVRPFLQFEQLIAAQPNIHNGRHLLPSHVDHPLKDGFGICIVTIAIQGNASVLVQSKTYKGKLPVAQGQAYLLSGSVRNQCAHGVLADPTSEYRESLNLRFGLHGPKTVSAEEILQHWGDDESATVKAATVKAATDKEENKNNSSSTTKKKSRVQEETGKDKDVESKQE